MTKSTLSTLSLLLMLILAGCSAGTPALSIPAEPADLDLPDGYAAEVLPYTFDRPTQFLVQEGQLWIAVLAGGENDGTGQVWQVDLQTGEESLILAGLDKPTGIALVEETLWIATRDEILRYELGQERGEPSPVLSDLPNNGRSNGTLTLTPAGEILYETSGNRRDSDSGKLWALNPTTFETRMVASGLKGAYAHAIDDEGRIWFTEIVDGSLGGVPYPDEINILVEGANYGWPGCYGVELTGTDCDGVTPAVVTFNAGSTPTGIIRSPFEEDALLVARWVSGDVVKVTYRFEGETAVGRPEPFMRGLNNPQHLVVLDDGSVLVSDYSAGKLYRISATGP